jgi:hypothetical protein
MIPAGAAVDQNTKNVIFQRTSFTLRNILSLKKKWLLKKHVVRFSAEGNNEKTLYGFKVIKADCSDTKHETEIQELLNIYASDPIY